MNSAPWRTTECGPKRLCALCAATLRRFAAHGPLAAVALGLLVALLLGLTLHPRLMLLVPAMVAILVLGVGWPWMSVLLVQGRLRFARDRVHELEEVSADLWIRQFAPWPSWALLLELEGAAPRALDVLRPFTTFSRSIHFRPDRRGTFPARVAHVATGFPFGLCVARRRLPIDRPLLVWPRVFPVAAPPDWASAGASGGHVETRLAGSGGETVGVRAYRRGDPIRWIHWPQTARHDSFMVREFPAPSTPRARIVLDCRSSVHVGHGTDGSLEWAVRMAASVAVGWLDAGAEIELCAGRTRIKASGGRQQRVRILDALARVQTGDLLDTATLTDRLLPTLFISTDVGWKDVGESASRGLHGFALRAAGFGGGSTDPLGTVNAAVVVEKPVEVPAALIRVKQGLADAA